MYNTIGLYIDMGTGEKSLKDICSFKTEQSYDDFSKTTSESMKNCNSFLKYDVQIKESDGVLISYTFELFKKKLFS